MRRLSCGSAGPAPMPDTLTSKFDLRALLETSRLLSSSLELDFVLGNLLLVAMSKLFVTRGVVLLDDPLAGGFRVEAVKGVRTLQQGDVIPIAPVPEMPVEGVAVPEALGTHGVALLLPIVYHERIIGLLGLGAKPTGGGFSGDEHAFVDALVNMSAAAVHNARVVAELQEANLDLGHKVQQLNTLFDLSQEFNRTLDADRSVKLLSFALMGQLLVQRFAFLLRRGGERLEVAAARNAGGLGSEVVQRLGTLARLLLLDDETDPAWADLRARGFVLAVPLRMQEETRGVLLLGPKQTGQPYEADEVEFVSALGALALTSVENARGVADRIERERLEEELRLARGIQERLLPQELPAVAGADLAALNLPSRFVAGDYFDAAILSEHRLGVAVADVSGKGIPASLLMSNLQAAIQVLQDSLAAGTISLAQATARINNVVHRNTGLTTFITFFWGIYDRRDGRFRYVNAGHNPPLLVRDGAVEKLEEGGVLLGVLPDAPYAEGEVTLAPGDVLVLYTDGVTEAWSASDPDDEYGEDRLLEAVRAHRDAPAQSVLDAVRADVRRHTGGGPLDDDLTLLVLKREA